MNARLNALYSAKWSELEQKLVEIYQNDQYQIKPTNPLLVNLEKNDYESADIKIVIFGQETNDWYGSYNSDMIYPLKEYKNFFNKGYALNSYGGHFWNGINRFLALLKKQYPGKKVGLVWNNVVKIGCNGRNLNTPPHYIYNIEKEHFNVIKEELDILKPNVILFLSGPNYDYAIKNSFGAYSESSVSPEYSNRQLARLNIGYGNNVFRTYHPNYLFRNKIDNYFSTIIQALSL